MSVYIRGMEMPTTGLYFVSVDSSNGCDKTVITVERMLGNRDVRQIVGSFELAPVPPHGRLIDADALHYNRIRIAHPDGAVGGWNAVVMSAEIKDAPTIISADPEKEEDHVYSG